MMLSNGENRVGHPGLDGEEIEVSGKRWERKESQDRTWNQEER